MQDARSKKSLKTMVVLYFESAQYNFEMHGQYSTLCLRSKIEVHYHRRPFSFRRDESLEILINFLYL